jgi:hypothetical protein
LFVVDAIEIVDGHLNVVIIHGVNKLSHACDNNETVSILNDEHRFYFLLSRHGAVGVREFQTIESSSCRVVPAAADDDDDKICLNISENSASPRDNEEETLTSHAHTLMRDSLKKQ